MPKPVPSARLSAALGVLGLTPLEAEVYAFLLAESPATGYRVAQAVGKSIGSIYKTLEGLESKGVVAASDDAGVRVVRAVALEELLAARRRELDAAAGVARAALRPDSDTDAAADELVYRLTGREQVIERASAMLAAATDFCIVTATPVLAGVLAGPLRRAAGRAVHVGLKAFAAVDIPGVRVVMDPRGQDAVARGPGEWLQVTSDAREMLIAIFDHRGEVLHTATWTTHTHLNWAMYTGHSSNFIFAAVRSALAEGASASEVKELMAGLVAFQTPRSVSKLRLMERFRSPNPAGRHARSAPGVALPGSPVVDSAERVRTKKKGRPS